jgi:hypothetical protein
MIARERGFPALAALLETAAAAASGPGPADATDSNDIVEGSVDSGSVAKPAKVKLVPVGPTGKLVPAL